MKKQLDERDPPGWYRCKVKNFNVLVHAVCWWSGKKLYRFDDEKHSFLDGGFFDFERMELADELRTTSN